MDHRRRIALASAAAALLPQVAAAQDSPTVLPSAGVLYEQLSDHDRALLHAAGTLELRITEESSLLDPECGAVTWKVRATTDGTSWAAEKASPEYAVAVPEGLRSFSQRSSWQRSADGSVEWVRVAHERVLRTPTVYRRSTASLYQKFAADGVLLEEAVLDRVSVDNLPASGPAGQGLLEEWLLATGRGFSPLLGSIEEVHEEDGLLAVTASGRWYGREGRWRLLLDPGAGLLARRADFEGFRLRFEGEVPSEAGPLAASCRRIDALGFLEPRAEPWRATLVTYQATADPDLLARLTAELGGTLRPPYLLTDWDTPSGEPVRSRVEKR